jgi:hypothetical protein
VRVGPEQPRLEGWIIGADRIVVPYLGTLLGRPRLEAKQARPTETESGGNAYIQS